MYFLFLFVKWCVNIFLYLVRVFLVVVILDYGKDYWLELVVSKGNKSISNVFCL